MMLKFPSAGICALWKWRLVCAAGYRFGARRPGIVGKDLQPVARACIQTNAGEIARITRYLEDGELPIDNNHTWRSLRGIAIGRHNWAFVGSDRGGRGWQSRKQAKVDPLAWFQDALSRVVAHSIRSSRNCCPTVGPPLGCRMCTLNVRFQLLS